MVPYRKSKAPPPPFATPECPLASCLGYLRGAWTPSLLWFLQAGPRRFNELRGDLRSVSAKVLAAHLRRLESAGLVHRERRPTSPATVEYSLTELGRQLTPALELLLRVGHSVAHRVRTTTSDGRLP